eukprot:6168608-Pyramimonas_sp.AAC.1
MRRRRARQRQRQARQRQRQATGPDGAASCSVVSWRPPRARRPTSAPRSLGCRFGGACRSETAPG